MGLFNRFKSNKNKHAEEFKKAYEANDMEKVNHVLVDWLDDGPHNALFGLAMAILVATRRDKDLVEALAIYKSSIEQDKEDSILFDWYNSTALRLLDEWAGEEINKNPELKNKMDGASKNDCSNTDFEDLTCKEFSAKFKELYEAFADNDDVINRKIFEKFRNTNRVKLIAGGNCEELKGYISQCRFFIGARTHATIAAYSSCIPTLVMGYSVKSRGIAKDLFNDYAHFVVPVQDLESKEISPVCSNFFKAP